MMNKYDIEFINILRQYLNTEESLKLGNLTTYTQDYKSSLITKKNNGTYPNRGIKEKGENIRAKSYILQLIASDYPINLLSEYSLLNIESRNLKDIIRKESLENSSKIINKNKEIISQIKHNFYDFEKTSKSSPLCILSNVFGSVKLNKEFVAKKLIIYKGLIQLKKTIPKLAGLTELPDLVESLIQSNMVDDALNALEYGRSTIKLLEASIFSVTGTSSVNSGSNIANTIIKKIKLNFEIKISKLYKVLKNKLNSSRLSLINAIETIGQLRRLIYLGEHSNLFNTDILYKQLQNNKNGLYTEYILGGLFLDARTEFIDYQYICKSINLMNVNNSASLDSALALFSSTLILTLSTYGSIFSNCHNNSMLSTYWINCYINWFIQICKKSLTLLRYETYKHSICKQTNSSQPYKLATKTVYIALFSLKSIPFTAYSCHRLYMDIMNTFSFSRSIQLAILPLFESYMVEYYRKLLEYSLEIFAYESREYAKNFKYNSESENIKPFEILRNEYINAINELRLCPFLSISAFIIDLTIVFLDFIFIETGEMVKKISNNRTNDVQDDFPLCNNNNNML
ncbi:hypothetical protein FG386_002515 [Cryptosporidium ryanae]|uniref:uncharacterized protein n=1 Tax=Cryptosporidium ryanae TaxID=515981 RepID=UPI00351A445F|nr:hypothetical protein FG386_002515 [Cryptosporidium ryanae]